MLTDMQCYEPVTTVDVDPQTGKRYQIIPTKIDLKLKYDAKGHPTKYKARLVALGNQEWPTLRDVFSPTINSKTINLLLALAAQQGFILYGLDIFGAFITATIDEPVYVQLPSGLTSPDGPPVLWKLLRTHYTASIEPRRHSTTNSRPSSSANRTAAPHTIPVSSSASHRTPTAYTSVSTKTISPSQLATNVSSPTSAIPSKNAAPSRSRTTLNPF